jgi:hypothetical protein
MKRILLEIGFIITALVAIFGIALVVFSFMNNDLLYNYFMGDEFNYIKYPLNIIIISFWIYMIVVWNKNDKKTGRLLLLLILNIYYLPFYYRNAVRKGWITKKE